MFLKYVVFSHTSQKPSNWALPRMDTAVLNSGRAYLMVRNVVYFKICNSYEVIFELSLLCVHLFALQ